MIFLSFEEHMVRWIIWHSPNSILCEQVISFKSRYLLLLSSKLSGKVYRSILFVKILLRQGQLQSKCFLLSLENSVIRRKYKILFSTLFDIRDGFD